MKGELGMRNLERGKGEADWMTVRLGDVVEMNPREALALADDETVGFVPMSAVCEVRKAIVAQESRSFLEVKRGYTPMQNGDVIVAKITPCFENGKVAMVDVDHEIVFGSTEFHVFRGKGMVNQRLIYHLLRSNFLNLKGRTQMKGAAGQKRVPADFFRAFEFRVPRSPSSQQRLAAILDKADALRRKRQEALRLTDDFLRSTFLDLFGDPVNNPKGWSEALTLGDVSHIVSGITKGRKISGEAVRRVPYLAVANVQDKALNLQSVKTIEASESEIKRYQLLKNDLLLTEGGDPDKLGRGTLWNDELPECIHQNHIFRVRLSSPDFDPLFLNWLVGSARGKKYFLRSAKQTTGIASINMTQLRAFPLLAPPAKLQREFARQVNAAEKLRQTQRAALSEQETLFSALQQLAFSGEL